MLTNSGKQGRRKEGLTPSAEQAGAGRRDEVSSHQPRKPALISVPTRWKVPSKQHTTTTHKCDLAPFVVRPCPSSLLPSTVRGLRQRGRRPCHQCDLGATRFCRGRNPTCRADCVAPCHETAGQPPGCSSAVRSRRRRSACRQGEGKEATSSTPWWPFSPPSLSRRSTSPSWRGRSNLRVSVSSDQCIVVTEVAS